MEGDAVLLYYYRFTGFWVIFEDNLPTLFQTNWPLGDMNISKQLPEPKFTIFNLMILLNLMQKVHSWPHI